MITDYTCRHCKAQCPPFRIRSASDKKYKRYTSTCKQCGAQYRIVGDSPVVEEVKRKRFESGGFVANNETPFVLPDAGEMIIRARNFESKEAQKARTNAVPSDVIRAVTLSLLSFELKQAEQLEQYERCAELRDKIKQLEI